MASGRAVGVASLSDASGGDGSTAEVDRISAWSSGDGPKASAAASDEAMGPRRRFKTPWG